MSDDNVIKLPPQPPQPWSKQHRAWVKAQIDDAAARARRALGAHDVLLVAWYQDLVQPQYLHVQDGGTAPMPPQDVYKFMARTVVENVEAGIEEVPIGQDDGPEPTKQ